MGLKEQWNSLTPAEKAVIASLGLKDPMKLEIIRLSKDKAFNETRSKFGNNGHNDDSDAFRHCFWSATLARDLGYFWAKLFTDAHETKPSQPPAEKEMDLHNNAVGLKIGFYYFSRDTDQVLSSKCFKALKNGELKVISP